MRCKVEHAYALKLRRSCALSIASPRSRRYTFAIRMCQELAGSALVLAARGECAEARAALSSAREYGRFGKGQRKTMPPLGSTT